jgi:glycerate kinase
MWTLVNDKMKKIVVAVDSFKGSLQSSEIAEAIESGIKEIYPNCEVVKVPVADGGEGTTEALVGATGGKMYSKEVYGPLMTLVEAKYGILGDKHTAVIEMSSASGLTLIPEEQRNPMLTTTYGTGQLIADALKNGCTEFILGIGGSATNDAGTGMLQALGYRFLDEGEHELGQGGRILQKIASVDVSSQNPFLDMARFKVACDVDNVFSGKQGAAYVFAPQKGADASMVKELDDGLENFARIIKRQFHKDISTVPGTGAAGGMGGGLLAFLNARLQSGIDLVLEVLDFEKLLVDADMVITGEGKMDSQTARGKVPYGIAKVSAKRGIPVIALTGNIEDAEAVNKIGINAVFSVMPRPMTLDEAMDSDTTKKNIKDTVRQLFLFNQTLNNRH